MRQQDAAAGGSKRRLLSPADNPLVRAVGRLPAGVHAKLLVAFVGTALLVVVLGMLGLRLLGQSNERVETLGTLQERAFAYGKLRSDAGHVRGLLAENVGGDYYKVLPEHDSKQDSRRSQPEDRPGDRERRRTDPGSRRSATISASGLQPRTSRSCAGFGQRANQLSKVMAEVIELDRADARTSDVPSPAGRADRDRPQPACDGARECPRPRRQTP